MFRPVPNLKPVSFILSFLFFFSTNLLGQYILTDDDVTMSYGRIASCSYGFQETDIVIPETLDGQTVIGIVNKGSGQLGVFDSKGITSVQLPATMEYVGDRAFIGNEITSVSFTGNTALERIGEYSFAYNSISSIDLTGCPSLKMIDEAAFRNNTFTSLSIAHANLEVIEHHAFRNCGITNLDLSNCPNLQLIGNYAFQGNSIETVSFTNSPSLNILGAYSFADNSLSDFDLSQFTSFVQMREYALTGNSEITSLTLPVPIDAGFTGWIDQSGASVDHTQPITDFTVMYSAVIPYTLTDEDVVMENNWIRSSSFDRKYTHIIIPAELDGQAVENIYNQGPGIYSNLNNFGVLGNRNLVSLKLPTSMKYVGINSFVNNPLIDVDFSACQNLNSLASQAFFNHKMTDVDLSPCIRLMFIESNALWSSTLSLYTLPTPSAPDFTFNHWYENSSSDTPHDGQASASQKYRANLTWNPDISFVVVNDKDEPIEDALVSFEGYDDQLTNAEGYAIFENTPAGGSFDYEVSKMNHTSENSNFISDQNSSRRQIDITLTQTAFEVSFSMVGKEGALANATVSLDGYGDQISGEDGIAFFPSVDPAVDLSYSVAASGYENKIGSTSVSDSDVNVEVEMDLIVYEVSFVISDGSAVKEGAEVSLSGYGEQITDAEGKVFFAEVVPEENISYSIEAEDYDVKIGSLSVLDANVSIEESLVLTTYQVTFIVSDEESVIEGANVKLHDYESASTDVNGEAVIANVLPGADLDYEVTADGYVILKGTLTVSDQDLTEKVGMITEFVLQANQNIEKEYVVYPNPASTRVVVKGAQGSSLAIHDLSGIRLISNLIVQDSQMVDLSRLSPGYYLLTVDNDTWRLVVE